MEMNNLSLRLFLEPLVLKAPSLKTSLAFSEPRRCLMHETEILRHVLNFLVGLVTHAMSDILGNGVL